uniref:acid phosphatase n=1 Tax=Setaria digitata TaxID=48799 RepID=A0A915PLP7_9BILA
MSTAAGVSAFSGHHEDTESETFSKSINKSKVYPVEGSALPETHNDNIEKAEIEESKKDLNVLEQQKYPCMKHPFRQHFKEVLTLLFVIIAIITTLIGITVYYFSTRPHHELIYINMIWRHGDRAPNDYLANFTEKYMVAFPRGIGNLTKIGAEQAEYLGKLLRNRYFQSRNISSEQIYVRSTDVFRTIETARYLLKGMLFPDVKVNVELSTDVDTAGNPFFHCPAALQFFSDQKEKYYLRENFSIAHDLAVPEWLKDEELYKKLKFLSWHGVEALLGIKSYDNEVQKKLRGGSALRGIVSRIACKVNYTAWRPVESCDETFFGLSAASLLSKISFTSHDMTIAALLSTFSDINSILGEVPLIGYGANIAFEIWQIDNSYKMRVLYANQWNEDPQEITKFAPGCQDETKFCSVTKFIDQSRLFFFDDVQKECSKGASNSTSHVRRRSVRAGDFGEIVDLIQMF